MNTERIRRIIRLDSGDEFSEFSLECFKNLEFCRVCVSQKLKSIISSLIELKISSLKLLNLALVKIASQYHQFLPAASAFGERFKTFHI